MAVPTFVEVALAGRFKGKGGSKLPVVVFSHGLGSCAKQHMILCREVASYGVLVVVLDHMEGSCGYTYNW